MTEVGYKLGGRMQTYNPKNRDYARGILQKFLCKYLQTTLLGKYSSLFTELTTTVIDSETNNSTYIQTATISSSQLNRSHLHSALVKAFEDISTQGLIRYVSVNSRSYRVLLDIRLTQFVRRYRVKLAPAVMQRLRLEKTFYRDEHGEERLIPVTELVGKTGQIWRGVEGGPNPAEGIDSSIVIIAALNLALTEPKLGVIETDDCARAMATRTETPKGTLLFPYSGEVVTISDKDVYKMTPAESIEDATGIWYLSLLSGLRCRTKAELLKGETVAITQRRFINYAGLAASLPAKESLTPDKYYRHEWLRANIYTVNIKPIMADIPQAYGIPVPVFQAAEDLPAHAIVGFDYSMGKLVAKRFFLKAKSGETVLAAVYQKTDTRGIDKTILINNALYDLPHSPTESLLDSIREILVVLITTVSNILADLPPEQLQQVKTLLSEYFNVQGACVKFFYVLDHSKEVGLTSAERDLMTTLANKLLGSETPSFKLAVHEVCPNFNAILRAAKQEYDATKPPSDPEEQQLETEHEEEGSQPTGPVFQ